MPWKKWCLLGSAVIALAAAPTYSSLILSGASSGLVTLIPPASFSSYFFRLPTTPGTAGQVLTSQGGTAPMTWATGNLTVGTTPITSGSNGRLLYDNAGVLGEELSTALTLNANQITQGAATTGQVLAWNGSVWAPANGGGSGSLTIGTTAITGGTSGYVLENVSGVLQNIATETADALPAATTPSGTDTVLAHQSGTSTVAMTLSNLASFVTSGGGVVTGLTDGTNTATGVVTLTGGKIAGATFANNGRNGTTIGRLPLASFSTWLNQSASIAVDNAPGPLSLQFQAQSGDTIRALVVTVPGTAPWTVTAQVNIGGQGGNNQQAGIVLTDTGGKAIVFYLAAQSSSSSISSSSSDSSPSCSSP